MWVLTRRFRNEIAYFYQKYSMKKLFGIWFVVVLGCSQNPDLVINGSIDTLEPTKIIRYIPDTNNQPRPYDTVVSKEGEFSFKITVDVPTLNFIMVEGQAGNFPFISEKGELQMSIETQNLTNSKVVGTLSNDDLIAFKEKSNEFGVGLNSLTTQINEARQFNDNLLVEELQKQYLQLQEEIKAYEVSLVKEKTNSYLAALMLDRMLNTKTIVPLQAKPIFSNYTSRIKNTTLGRAIEDKLNAPVSPTSIGNQAPNFTAPSPDGTLIELSQQLGKITILDFWASWCRPCRVENPNLVRTYNKLKNKGLHVVSVSLDRDKKRWIQAIQDDGLNWDHVSNLQYWRDPVAQLYKVSSIPATFILDENGVIIAKNLRGPELEATLSRLLQ